MIDFETWWNSSSADEFRRLNDDMDGRVVRPVWDAAIRATLSSQKATSAAPSPEAAQPTQAEAPSERVEKELREMQEVADKLREAGYHNAANNTKRTIADIRSGGVPRAVIGAALATQQAGQGEAVYWQWRRKKEAWSTDKIFNTAVFATTSDSEVRVLYTTPPAPQQPEALAQQERDREDALRDFFALHAAELEGNAYAYCELAYTRRTGWMAWITDKPLAYVVESTDRKVIAQGQGATPHEAARDAIRAARSSEGGSPSPSMVGREDTTHE